MKILEKQEAPLLNRIEVIAEFEHIGKSTPSKDSIKKEIASDLKTKEELIVVKHAFTKYGYGITKVFANVYKNEKDLRDIEIVKKKGKKGAKEAPKQEAPKAEPKKEEVKEDVKKEETKEQSTK